MAENGRAKKGGFTLQERHMAEILFAGLALLLTLVVVGGYMYLSGPHQQSHCPTISIATGRC